MAQTESKVESLIEESSGMADAIAIIVRETDRGDNEVEWTDVRDEISSGQWGRLIEKRVLVDGLQGFELQDPEAVRSVVNESGETTTSITPDADRDESEESEWTKYDKAAVAAVVLGMGGYIYAPARNAIGGTMDILFGPLMEVLPFYAVILIIALLTGLYSSLLQSNLMDTSKMSEYQERMKKIQEKRERAKEQDDDEALERIQEEQMEAMGDQLGMLKTQFRPMVWIFLLTIPVFLWMLWAVGARGIEPHYSAELLGQIVLPLIGGPFEWSESIVGPIEVWIVWYFVCSMAFTQLLRKSLNISTTSTD